MNHMKEKYLNDVVPAMKSGLESGKSDAVSES